MTATITKTFEFTIYLEGLSETSYDAGDRLAANGCDDGTFGSCNGSAFIEFDRDAQSLREAIDSAIDNVRAAGFDIARVTSDESEVIASVNEKLQSA